MDYRYWQQSPLVAQLLTWVHLNYVQQHLKEDGVRIWSGLNSNLFHDTENWHPNDIPSYFDTALFNSYGSTHISTSEKTVVDSLVSSAGNVKINLNGYVIRFESAIDPVRIGRTNEVASLSFETGTSICKANLRISGCWK